MTMNTPHDSPLGRDSAWPERFDPSLLFPIPRARARTELGLADASLPFRGVDLWNAYELSWLAPSGVPQVGIGRIEVPADSPNLIESKSLKLYLGSLANSVLADGDMLCRRIAQDLSLAAGATVKVELTPAANFPQERIGELEGECIDTTAVTISCYGPPQADVLLADASRVVEETLVSHLLKSNCPVTGQPDWASVQIRYRGPRLDRVGLLRYLVSYREHTGFHEQCVERIFVDLLRRCAPQILTVYARYTRRGGLDINPWRSTAAAAPPNPRLARQ